MKSRALIFSFFCLAGILPYSQAQYQASAAPVPESASSSVFGRDQLVNAVTAQFVEHFRPEGDLQLDLLRPWTSPAGATATTDAIVMDFPSALTSSIVVRVRVQNGTQVLGECTVAFRAQLLRDAWVLRMPVDRGASFDVTQLDTRRVDVLREHDLLPVSDSETSFTYTRPTPAGHLITWRDVARRSLVRRGEVIEVAAVDGGLTVTMKALAMENGAAGDTVKVRNLVTKKEFAAQVVADARALVRF
jgi:flagella basal body P-ring formation protein FlgA